MKKYLSIILCILSVLFVFQINIYAENKTMKITLNAKKESGYTLIECNITENPGFAYLKLSIEGSNDVTVSDIKNGAVSTDGFTVGDGGVVWDNVVDNTKTSCLCTFKINNDIKNIDINCIECYDINENSIKVDISLPTANALGDINGDEKINTKDARMILRYTAKLESFTDEQTASADVNGDGKVNTKDARKILRVVAKLETL